MDRIFDQVDERHTIPHGEQIHREGSNIVCTGRIFSDDGHVHGHQSKEHHLNCIYHLQKPYKHHVHFVLCSFHQWLLQVQVLVGQLPSVMNRTCWADSKKSRSDWFYPYDRVYEGEPKHVLPESASEPTT